MIKYIFGYPFGKYKINPKSYNKEGLMKNLHTNYTIDPKRNKWTNPFIRQSDLHMMYDDEDNKDFIKIDFKELLPLYDKAIRQYIDTFKLVKRVNYKYDIVNYTIGMENQIMQLHDHLPHCSFSSVHYLHYDPAKHPKTVFHNPHPLMHVLKYLKPDLTDCVDGQDSNNSFMFENWTMEVTEDDFIIFPSEVKHEIPRLSNTPTPRMTIVVNIIATPAT